MKCWNCLKQLPKAAKACPFCEAAVEAEPSTEEIEAVQEVLDLMPPEVLGELGALMANSNSAEDFINQIFVGDCPKCNRSETGDCEKDPEIDNLLVGRCFECGHMWCTECEKALNPKAPKCPCWDEEVEGFEEFDL